MRIIFNLCLISILVSSCKKASQPTAQFSISPSNPQELEQVTFVDESIGEIESWTWDFGNGSGATYHGQSENPTMSYPSGQYTISLTVQNEAGSNTITKTLDIGNPITLGSFIDSRDGTTYQTFTIGGIEWMAENLNYPVGNSWCYDDNTLNCQTYGRLYDWNTALTACPSGWHLPSDTEWMNLINQLGGLGVAGGKMKATTGWQSPNKAADNSSGFSGLPGGGRNYNGTYMEIGVSGYWWSSSQEPTDTTYAYRYMLSHLLSDIHRNIGQKRTGMSCRCVKD